ncbi:hypothetical protein FNV43_RR14626 [Rhamnella rubrinervis]|uniref:GDSL esterase/lipase n=1 Tax=Rhamnella rubrinervis TaxID=2594499 RepID=A0A8K0H3F7_9ROSA|nr:hypothetical protein FNV43_RR14626 [Rhamnella rubrinervis]
MMLLLLLNLVRYNVVWVMSAYSALAPALYVFGDSLFDSGNNNSWPTIAKADFLLYGVNFAKGVAGRFTNGRTVVDFGVFCHCHPMLQRFFRLLSVHSAACTNLIMHACINIVVNVDVNTNLYL